MISPSPPRQAQQWLPMSMAPWSRRRRLQRSTTFQHGCPSAATAKSCSASRRLSIPVTAPRRLLASLGSSRTRSAHHVSTERSSRRPCPQPPLPWANPTIQRRSTFQHGCPSVAMAESCSCTLGVSSAIGANKAAEINVPRGLPSADHEHPFGQRPRCRDAPSPARVRMPSERSRSPRPPDGPRHEWPAPPR